MHRFFRNSTGWWSLRSRPYLGRGLALSAALLLLQFLISAGTPGPVSSPAEPVPPRVAAVTPAATPLPTPTLAPTPYPLRAARIENVAAPRPSPARPTVVPAASPIYYTVQPGDTLYELAQRYLIPLRLLADYNGIDDPARIHAGFVLQIPTAGVLKGPGLTGGGAPRYADIYVVQPGDTLVSVAERVGLAPEVLARLNLIQPPYEIRAGQLLSLSGGHNYPQRAAAIPTTTPSPTPQPVAPGQQYVVQPGDTLGLIAALHRVPVDLLREENRLRSNIIYVGQSVRIPSHSFRELPPLGVLAWPVDNHSVIKGYFYGHEAIDMLLPIGSDVRAAAPGVVEIAGWHAYGYGNVIVIDHGHGIRTLYAHLNEFVAAAGQRVARGELIACSGHTGRSTHPHLHFEVQKDRRGLNPCLYLQGGCQ